MNHPLDLVSVLVDRCALPVERARVAERAIADALRQVVPAHAAAHFGGLLHGHAARLPIRNVAELATDVAVTLDLRPGPALELVEVACAAIADAMSGDELRVVHEALPGDVAALFVRSDNAERAPADVAAKRARRHTLSTGEPGPAHPVASSPESDGAHSLAAGEPGGARPIASSPTSTGAHTLATGKPPRP